MTLGKNSHHQAVMKFVDFFEDTQIQLVNDLKSDPGMVNNIFYVLNTMWTKSDAHPWFPSRLKNFFFASILQDPLQANALFVKDLHFPASFLHGKISEKE